MSVRTEVQVTSGGVLVTVRGVIERDVGDVAACLAGLGRDGEEVVVDLRDAVLASQRGLQDLVTAVCRHAVAGRVTLVCDRLAGRRLLRLVAGSGQVRVLGEVPATPASAGAG
jgi:hypothetical protein